MQGVIYDKLLHWEICKGKLLTGPRRLEVEINNRCNLGCLFCWFHSPGRQKKISNWELGLSLFKKIIDDATDLGVQHLYITGRGEPCLHPDLPEMLRYAKHKGLYVTLTTNLTLISKEILSSILLIDKLEITLCGYPEKKYKEIHCPMTDSVFPVLIRNISHISRIASIKKKPLVKINYILTRKNSDNIDSLIAFCRKVGIQEVRLSPFSFTPENRSLKMTTRQTIKLRRKFSRSNPSSGLIIDNTWLRLNDIKIKGCYMGWVTALVGEFGEVKIGCFDSPFAADGNIYKNSFKEIWHSPAAQANRLKLKDSLKDLKFCPFYSLSLKKQGIFCPFAIENETIEKNLRNMPALCL